LSLNDIGVTLHGHGRVNSRRLKDQPRINVADAAGESVHTEDNELSRFSENVDLESIGLFDAVQYTYQQFRHKLAGNRFDS